MYSYLEINHSVKRINKCFSFFNDINVEKSKYSEFEKEIDVLNSKMELDKNIDKSLKELKIKYS